jgi:hypothetical protein
MQDPAIWGRGERGGLGTLEAKNQEDIGLSIRKEPATSLRPGSTQWPPFVAHLAASGPSACIFSVA